ncbi:unnamed protein product [Triticum turgidum subsp. durum]|uniref:Uncharacterized protein n=1 Tax=Triticum turgidum subsp. durum TaxID=4567 RepID=A0A9R0UUP6_TRITD|nr:unnamed protein product [Triticum turgidum subsp. durum]
MLMVNVHGQPEIRIASGFLMAVVHIPRQFKVPYWFLNRKKDYKEGRFSQVVSNAVDMKLRDDLERFKKIRELELGQGSKQCCWLLGARSSKMAEHGVWRPILLPRAVLFT